eukprot:861777-Pleurochrysis_carterae.AAC.2
MQKAASSSISTFFPPTPQPSRRLTARTVQAASPETAGMTNRTSQIAETCRILCFHLPRWHSDCAQRVGQRRREAGAGGVAVRSEVKRRQHRRRRRRRPAEAKKRAAPRAQMRGVGGTCVRASACVRVRACECVRA